jgi:YidC/Oxa1 family membrane protein insertase
MNLFELILSPFTSIIETIFLFSYSLTGNYGVAIILLSFSVSLLLLPIFIYIEKAKKKDDAIKRKMQPLIDEIKRCYKGQERYYYIKTINRQHNYNSLKALIPILSLLIQIPFFIAAYQYLEKFQPLQNVSFGFIPDLSKPDGLFGIVNILPIIMTLVNVITAYFYTRYSNKKEFKQMLVVAAAFLVLLFNLPSGLVLYWTMNNVFSFFRLFVTNPEVFKIKSKAKRNFKLTGDISGVFRIVGISFVVFFAALLFIHLKWAFKYSFDDIWLRILVSIPISIVASVTYGFILFYKNRIGDYVNKIEIQSRMYYVLLFLSIYFYYSSLYYFTGENLALSIFAVITLIPTQIISAVYLKRNIAKLSKGFSISSSLLVKSIFIYQLFVLVSVFSKDGIDLSFGQMSVHVIHSHILSFVGIGIVYSILAFIIYLKFSRITSNYEKGSHWLVLLLSAIYVFGLLFIWNPIIVYSSFPANFDFPAFKIFTENLSLTTIGLFFTFVVFIILPKKLRPLFVQIFLSLTAIVFLYSSIIPFNVGTLQINIYSDDHKLAVLPYFYLFEALGLIAVFIFISRIYKSKNMKTIVYSLTVLNIFIVGQSIYSARKTSQYYNKPKSETKGNEINFSKNHKNIVYFIIDEAQGWYMNEIMKEDPSIKEEYDGFKWYPNTISTSNFTYASVPSMMCGESYSIANMNKDTTTNIIEKVTNATSLFYDHVKSKGYYLTAHHLKYAQSGPISKIDNFLPKWNEKWSEKMNVSSINTFWFNRLWQNALFSSSPIFLKPKVYNKSKWFDDFFGVSNTLITSKDLLSKYTFVKLLPKISNNKSDTANFIFIHSMFTHNPMDLVTEDNRLIQNVSPYENQKQFTHLFTRWIQWMKDNDVYDNTKIILVSDHGKMWWNYKTIDSRGVPIKWSSEKKVNMDEFLRLNPLLLVKNFNQRGKLTEDWRFMSNMDAYSIAFDENDPTKTDSTSRTLYTYYTKWHRDLYSRKKYKVNLAYKVKNYVFDLDNWESIIESN